MRILLTFTGFHDPYSKGLVGEDDQPGPILSLLESRSFDLVYLLGTPNTARHSTDTASALREKVNVEEVFLPLEDPTQYAAILKHLRTITNGVVEQYAGAEFFVSVASGTPQMHACWLLLTCSGEFPARILHVRPPRFVSKDRPIVSEVDLTSHDFPIVRPRIEVVEPDGDNAPNVGAVLIELGLVADHPKMAVAINVAATLAPSAAPVLILGATGTGKELLAKFVHRLSGRPKERFIALNCAAIPKDLVESLLFGHKRGAFTGALTAQTGKFELADGGTLFLDEIGELPLDIQPKLLRVVQDGIVEPLGAKESRKVDARIIAATNKNLARAVEQGTFREDLYYRLNVGQIRLPSLRDRRSDIPKITLQVLDKINATLKKPKRLSQAALARLQGQNWPGNVRDLENVIERSARLAQKDLIDADGLIIFEPVAKEDPLSFLPEPAEGFSMEQFLASARKQFLLRAMDAAHGNQSEAARLLGVSPQAVHKHILKLKKHSI
jgi:DNA-binding NtrC family response regulator